MSLEIPESDWRRFKQVHRTLLDRYCACTLAEVVAAAQASEGTAHEKFLRVYKLIHKRDKDMARAFEDYRRSTAMMQLSIMRRMKLLTDEDLSVFSEETQERIRGIASL